MSNLYGAQETNPINAGYHSEVTEHINGRVEWTDSRLAKIIRLRLITDVGFPMWDVSYCHGQLQDGTYVEVELPFNQLPRGYKKGDQKSGAMLTALIKHANHDNVNLKRLGVFSAISTLV